MCVGTQFCSRVARVCWCRSSKTLLILIIRVWPPRPWSPRCVAHGLIARACWRWSSRPLLILVIRVCPPPPWSWRCVAHSLISGEQNLTLARTARSKPFKTYFRDLNVFATANERKILHHQRRCSFTRNSYTLMSRAGHYIYIWDCIITDLWLTINRSLRLPFGAFAVKIMFPLYYSTNFLIRSYIICKRSFSNCVEMSLSVILQRPLFYFQQRTRKTTPR